jgi:hypothetical protein
LIARLNVACNIEEVRMRSVSSQTGRLPNRFPVGTRYVVEGRGVGRGRLRVASRYLEFPNGRHVDLSTDAGATVRPSRGKASPRLVR